MTLLRRLTCLMRISEASPATFTTSQVCSSSPDACFLTVRRTPSWMASMATDLPRPAEVDAVIVVPLVATEAPTSPRRRNLKTDGDMFVGPSVSK